MTIFDKIINAEDNVVSKVMTVPTLLSECGTRVTLDEKDKYNIEIEAGDYLVVCMGFTAGKGGANFTHPNIAATSKKVHEFKHYRTNGSKFWTSRAGINHYLVIPRNQIKLLPEKGYSFIKAKINGVKVSFNVTGGGGTDFLSTSAHTCINHKLLDFKKICEVAIRNSPFEPLVVKTLEPNDEEKWNSLAAKATPKIKERIAKMVEEGKKPIIQFVPFISYQGAKSGVAIKVQRRAKMVPIADKPGSFSFEETGALRYFILALGFNGVRAKVSQIDWYKTAELNGIII